MMEKQENCLCRAIAHIWQAFSIVVLWCFLALVTYALFMPATAAEIGKVDKEKFAMTFDKLPVQQLVMVFYDQCEKRGVVFDPALNKLEELITLKTPSSSCVQTKIVLLDALARAGVAIDERGSYDVIRPHQARDEREGWVEMIYRPRFRDAVDLAEQSQIAIRKGMFAHQRRTAQVQVSSSPQQVPESGENGATITAKSVDKLVFFGPNLEAKAVLSLLARLDVPHPQIEIKAGIYEFQKGNSEGAAINAVVSLFNSKLGITINGGASSGSSVSVKLPSLDAALQLLDNDSRFKYVARPTVLTKDGESVRFFAGEDVRVVGAIVLDRNGNPIQSKETLSAGVTLEATPRIRADVVDLTLYQAVSNFVAGANGDPSVLKRDLRSRLVMQPGLVYVIGGLQSSRKTYSNQRFFGFPVGKSEDVSQTEVVLLLSVQPDQTSF